MQYTPPGGPEAKPQDRKASLEREVEAARFHLGAIRLAPWFGVRDGAYVRSLFASGVEPPADFTITVGAGLNAYLRTGPKLTWKAEVLPEYLYWQKQSDRRRLNGRYRLNAFGYFNRLTLEADAGRVQEQRIITPEVPIPATARTDSERLLAEVEITRLLRPFALLTLSQTRNLVDQEIDPRTGALGKLDRKETVLRAGVRIRSARQWTIGFGGERSRVDFDRSAADRSNEGTAPFVEARLERRRLSFDANVAFRSLRARNRVAFVAYDRPTGDLSATLRVARRANLSLYASRALVYGLSRDTSYLEDSRLGAALLLDLGSRLNARFFYEEGSNDYTPTEPAAGARSDDYQGYGSTLTFHLTGGLTLAVNALSARFDANVAGADRSYRSVGASLNFGSR